MRSAAHGSALGSAPLHRRVASLLLFRLVLLPAGHAAAIRRRVRSDADASSLIQTNFTLDPLLAVGRAAGAQRGGTSLVQTDLDRPRVLKNISDIRPRVRTARKVVRRVINTVRSGWAAADEVLKNISDTRSRAERGRAQRLRARTAAEVSKNISDTRSRAAKRRRAQSLRARTAEAPTCCYCAAEVTEGGDDESELRKPKKPEKPEGGSWMSSIRHSMSHFMASATCDKGCTSIYLAEDDCNITKIVEKFGGRKAIAMGYLRNLDKGRAEGFDWLTSHITKDSEKLEATEAIQKQKDTIRNIAEKWALHYAKAHHCADEKVPNPDELSEKAKKVGEIVGKLFDDENGAGAGEDKSEVTQLMTQLVEHPMTPPTALKDWSDELLKSDACNFGLTGCSTVFYEKTYARLECKRVAEDHDKCLAYLTKEFQTAARKEVGGEGGAEPPKGYERKTGEAPEWLERTELTATMFKILPRLEDRITKLKRCPAGTTEDAETFLEEVFEMKGETTNVHASLKVLGVSIVPHFYSKVCEKLGITPYTDEGKAHFDKQDDEEKKKKKAEEDAKEGGNKEGENKEDELLDEEDEEEDELLDEEDEEDPVKQDGENGGGDNKDPVKQDGENGGGDNKDNGTTEREKNEEEKNKEEKKEEEKKEEEKKEKKEAENTEDKDKAEQKDDNKADTEDTSNGDNKAKDTGNTEEGEEKQAEDDSVGGAKDRA